eukprot:4048813-Ditylum_brightwellii.AAC.1
MWKATTNIFQDRLMPPVLMLCPATESFSPSMSRVIETPAMDSGPSQIILAMFLLYPIHDVNTLLVSVSISSSLACVKKH